MKINRGDAFKMHCRDALKFGGASVVGGAALAVPLGRAAQTKAPSQLSAANFPLGACPMAPREGGLL